MGPTMSGHILHCVGCGAEKHIKPDKLPLELYGYYGEDFEWTSELRTQEPKLTKKIVGLCKCGGYFSLLAPARCPHCKSIDLTKHDDLIMRID